jgi:hypothetical protein
VQGLTCPATVLSSTGLQEISMLPLLMAMGALLLTVIGYALLNPDPGPHDRFDEDAGG